MSEGDSGTEGFPVRVFCDAEDRAWEVRAIRPLALERRVRVVPGNHANGWLLFSLGLERRRLAPLPDGWQQASELQLQRWWVQAQPVVERNAGERASGSH
jgi:hypothetical protein